MALCRYWSTTMKHEDIGQTAHPRRSPRVTALGVSRQLVEWAELAGYAFTPEDHSGAALFWSDPGGEIRYYIRRSSDGFTLTKSERAAAEQFELFAGSLGVIEPYLFGVFGWEIRSKLRLARLKIPRKLEEIADKYRIEDADSEDSRSLLDERGERIAVARGKVSGVAVLVELSHLLTSRVDQIQSSYQDVDGRPLFRT